MKEETFYRMLADAELECQHCGAGISILKIVSGGQMIGGSIQRHCTTCRGYLPQMEIRTYGVKTSDRSVANGFPSSNIRHWTVSGKKLPLWAIGYD